MSKEQSVGCCIACSATLVQPSRGRRRVYCSKQCRDLQRQQRDKQKTSGIKGRKKKRVDWSCHACAKTFSLRPFEALSKLYCSRRCANGARPSSEGRGPYKCKHCQKSYFTKRPKGEGETFCSRSCSEAYRPLRAGPHTRITFHNCEHCRKRFASRRGVKLCSISCRLEAGRARSKKLEVKKSQRRKPIHCQQCGCLFSRLYGNKSRLCSDQCAVAASQSLKRKAKAARRASERAGRKAFGAFDPFEVFERDGWECALCNVPTPEVLRGTTANAAPELDHVRPLSKGGQHSKENTQLLCRSCNLGKSDQWPAPDG
ncbi:HNH endonuclease [Halomonas sp. MS1]